MYSLHILLSLVVLVSSDELKTNLKDSLDDYTKKLVLNSDVLHAMKAYRKAYALAEGTDCAKVVPPENEDVDYGYIKSFTDGCGKSIALDELDDFLNKVFLLKGEVLEIYNNLHETCTFNPSSCDEAKKDALEKLNGILTPKHDAELKSGASAVLEILKTRMDECFKSDTAEFLGELVQETKDMNTCLAAKS